MMQAYVAGDEVVFSFKDPKLGEQLAELLHEFARDKMEERNNGACIEFLEAENQIRESVSMLEMDFEDL